MKRFFSLLLAGLLLLSPTVPSFAQEGVPGEIPVAIGTITNANIVGVATVATGAFIHSFAGATLANYLGHKIRLCDASTPVHCVTGYIKAAGTAEALGAENFTDPTFDVDATWTKGAGWTVGVTGKANAITAASTAIYTLNTLTVGALYKMVLTSDVVGAGTYQGAIDGVSAGVAVNTVGATSWYYTDVTGINSGGGILAATTLTATFTDISLKRTTAPSATGVTISSTKGGTTQSWAATEAGFDANSATFTYTISKVHAATVVAGAAIAATAVHVQTVSPALVFLDAIDLSPYASTATASYYLCLYDSSNRALCAYAGDVGAGEGLDVELVGAGNCENSGSLPYDTFDGASATGFHAIRTTAGSKYAGTADQLVWTSGWLTKWTATLTLTSGTAPTWSLRDSIAGTTRSNSTLMANGANATYGTVINSTTGVVNFTNSANVEFTVASISVKRVTAGPTTGLDLRSTSKLGGTQVPVFTTTGFDPNAVTRWSIMYVGS